MKLGLAGVDLSDMEIDPFSIDFTPGAVSVIQSELQPIVLPQDVSLGTADAIDARERITFDIETGPADLAIIESMMKPGANFVEPAPWDDSMARYGNAKKADKRAEILKEQKEKYLAESSQAKAKWEAALAERRQKAIDDAALRAETACVLAIGYRQSQDRGDVSIIAGHEMDEIDLIGDFWDLVGQVNKQGGRLVGHYCKTFDLPMLIRRSYILGLSVPSFVLEKMRWWHPMFVDTMEVWACGSKDYISVDQLARIFGVGQKNGDGKNFANLWRADRNSAIAYLANDLQIQHDIARKMNLLV